MKRKGLQEERKSGKKGERAGRKKMVTFCERIKEDNLVKNPFSLSVILSAAKDLLLGKHVSFWKETITNGILHYAALRSG